MSEQIGMKIFAYFQVFNCYVKILVRRNLTAS